MSQISQCDCEDCYNMEFEHAVFHVDNETESFLLKHFPHSFKCKTIIGDICEECIDELNADYEELFVFDNYRNLSINEKYIKNPELLEQP